MINECIEFFRLVRHSARQITGFTDVFVKIVEFPDCRVFRMGLESSNQLPVTLVDRNRRDQVRKPCEVRLPFEPTSLLENRDNRFAIHDVTCRRFQTDGIRNELQGSHA